MVAFITTLLTAIIAILIGIYLLPQDRDVILNLKLNTTYDYIIVGAGSSGAVIANRLSEDKDVSVLLIEAGGSEYGNDDIRIPIMASACENTTTDWAFYTTSQKYALHMKQEQKCFWPRGKVLGGSSSINYMAYVRGSKYDYNNWEAEGCTGWSYKDVLPYFLKIEDIRIPRLYKSAYHSSGGYLGVSELRLTELQEIYRRAANEIGIKTVDLNGENQLGYSDVQYSIKKGERENTAKAYLRPVIHRANLHISINTFVTKVLFEDKKAVGIEAIRDNRKTKFYANKEVILSAGAINSPAILMLSGIGPKKHLGELKIPVVADLPVGENLQDHYQFFMTYKIKKPYNINSDVGNSLLNTVQYIVLGQGPFSGTGLEGHIFGKMPDRDGPLYPDYQLQFYSAASDDEFIDHGLPLNFNESVKQLLKTISSTMEFSIAVTGLHPRCKGTVRLRSQDPFDYPIIDPNYLCHPDDVKILIAGTRAVRQLEQTKAFKEIGTVLKKMDFQDICDTMEFDSDRYWDCIIRYWGTTGYHPTSTCRMGAKNDKNAVVDQELRVKGIAGLRVADASVMRHLTSGNTNAPCIMIGEKASDLIKGKDTVKDFREKIKHLKL